MPLHAEDLATSRRSFQDVVRVATVKQERKPLAGATPVYEQGAVKRAPTGRMADAVPSSRQKGDRPIPPVVEKVVAVERRLVLKREDSMGRLRSTERHLPVLALRPSDGVTTRPGAARNRLVISASPSGLTTMPSRSKSHD